MSHELTFPRTGTAIAPGSTGQALFPRGYTITPPGSPGETLMPRGFDGLDAEAETIPTPLIYYTLDSFGASLADEMGLLDLDSVADAEAATGINGDAVTNTTGNTANLRRATSATTYSIFHTLISAWVKLGASGTIMLAAKASGSADYQFGLELSGHVPADASWHHVLISFSDLATDLAYISIDGAERVEAGGIIAFTVWGCPSFSITIGAILDEVAWIFLTAEPSAAAVTAYANAIHNSGTGRFYRTLGGWAAP